MAIQPEHAVPIDISDELRTSFMDYAMSVIISRALPDVRDGLKPVHRRILVTMRDLNLTATRAYRKCAKIAGDVSGNYHPHGETVVYPSLVRMAQDFSLRYPLIDGQGNFGSIDGDPPAAMRYTEARMTRIGEEMLRDINKNTVDYAPNYDGTRDEPVVLPSAIPNLLVNGSSGIAVGMATNIPPHNLAEVVDALIVQLISFLEHRREVVIRRTRYDLERAQEREHILAGLMVALDHLDAVIQLIRGAASPAEARQELVTRLALSETQAQAILDLRLQRLTGLERDKILQEHAELLEI